MQLYLITATFSFISSHRNHIQQSIRRRPADGGQFCVCRHLQGVNFNISRLPITSASLGAVPPDLHEAVEVRFSLCCAAARAAGARVLPPLVRNLGGQYRVGGDFREPLPFSTAISGCHVCRRLKGLCGVWRSTVEPRL